VSEHGTTVLFGLPGLRVVEVRSGGADGRVVQVVTDEVHAVLAAACPVGGVFSGRVRQHRTTTPRDLPFGEEPLSVCWGKAQYACDEAACPRKAFTENVPEVPAGARVTGRLRRHAGLVQAGAAVSWVCGRLGLAWPLVHGSYVQAVDSAAAPVGVLPAVSRLGIDETRRGQVRRQWDSTADGGRGGVGPG